jgi:hypothetical protein
MAQQDLTGLLTGITQAPIDPMAGQSMAQRQLSFGAQAAQGLRQGMGGLFGADTRTTTEKADQMMANLDVTKKADRDQMLQIVGNVNPQAFLPLKAKFEQVEKEQQQNTNIKESLLRIARTQGNAEMEDFIKQGGDLRTAASVLFREKKAPLKPAAPAALSGEELKNYDAILDNYLTTIAEKTWPESVSIEGAVYGRNKKKPKELRPIFLKAEELRRLNPDLPMQAALLQAMGSAPTTPAGGEKETVATPNASSSVDMYQNAPIESERGGRNG